MALGLGRCQQAIASKTYLLLNADNYGSAGFCFLLNWQCSVFIPGLSVLHWIVGAVSNTRPKGMLADVLARHKHECTAAVGVCHNHPHSSSYSTYLSPKFHGGKGGN